MSQQQFDPQYWQGYFKHRNIFLLQVGNHRQTQKESPNSMILICFEKFQFGSFFPSVTSRLFELNS